MATHPLTGTVAFPKGIATEDFWHSEPFDRPRAYMDLWFLANDRRRQLTTRGGPLTVERGQLAWSVVQLAERWRCSRPKATAILSQLQDDRLIMLRPTNYTTIITVIDYTVYNPDTAPEMITELTPDLTAELQPKSSGFDSGINTGKAANFTQKIGSTEEGSTEEEKGEGQTPAKASNGHWPEVEVPGLEEFLAACEMRGLPRWFGEREYAWRAERPADRWPHGAHWVTAVTSAKCRWVSEGSPVDPDRKNGARKTATVWELRQRLEVLHTQVQNHPANEGSAAWAGEPNEAERADLEQIQKNISDLERQIAGGKVDVVD